MKKHILIVLLFILPIMNSIGQTDESEDKKAIKAVLSAQSKAWSNNNIEKFMEGYWKNDSLKFYGSNGITYGWQNTLNKYKKSYPTKAHTGTLKFGINAITKINKTAYYVMGEYHLSRSIGDADGIFMIILKNINGEWKIIADTSS